jgi:hypothetical protein
LQSAIRRPRAIPGYMRTPVPMIDTGPVAKQEPEPEADEPEPEPEEGELTPTETPPPIAMPSILQRGEDAEPLAGEGDDSDDGSPVPIVDVVTGPSGPVQMPRRDRDRDRGPN